MRIRNPVIALTGGPGGGKTTLMRELREADPEARRWLFVPEAAPLLFQAGLNGREKSFQRAVVQWQMAMEDVCLTASQPGQVLLCHRGALDPLAYWLRNGWDEGEFFEFLGFRPEEFTVRYDGVVHLQTAAIDAAQHYRRWPEAHRPETPDQAAEIDRLCVRAWGDHSRHVSIGNKGHDWLQKSAAAVETLRRFLVEGPN